MTATSNPAIIQGLAAGTQYRATVAALCPDGNRSPLSSSATFTTPCLPIPTDSLPYTETFDSYPATTDLADGQVLPPCWSKGTNGPTAFPYLYYDSSVAPSNLMLFSSSPTLYTYAVLPLFADSLNRLLRIQRILIAASIAITILTLLFVLLLIVRPLYQSVHSIQKDKSFPVRAPKSFVLLRKSIIRCMRPYWNRSNRSTPF
jgi:hypothetical protein